MKNIERVLSFVLCVTLMLSTLCACAKQEAPAVTEAVPTETQQTVPAETQAEEAVTEPAEAELVFYDVGDKMADFTVTTYDGKEVSLYQVLEEKEMVLLNLWATWCGPCGSEFPAMQEAYEKYQDKVEIIAVSVYEGDTDEILAEYVKEKGMTFCVCTDTAGVGALIDHTYIPTSVVIDRFGTICLKESNAMPDPAVFENLFEIYTGDDYTESVFMPSMLSELPGAEPSEPEKLGEALNAEGGNLVFANSENMFTWPMSVEKKDGRSVVSASNVKSYYSVSCVETQVDVKAGDVLVVEYKLQSNANDNAMSLEVDGKQVKKTSLTRDWNTYAYRFEEEGTHNVEISFHVETNADAKNGLWIDTIQVVSGDEAAKALAANPQYPVAEATEMKVLNEDVKAGRVYDTTDPSRFDPIIICPDEKLQLLVKLDETLDPEAVYVRDLVGYEEGVLAHMTEDGYLLEVDNTTYANIGYAGLEVEGSTLAELVFFNSTESLDEYIALVKQTYGTELAWEYTESAPAGNVTYTVTYVDQNGDPVPGVLCQVCDESTCQVFTSDENGVCKFTLAAKEYEIHTLAVPAGYEGDTTTVTKAPIQGGALSFTLTRK